MTLDQIFSRFFKIFRGIKDKDIRGYNSKSWVYFFYSFLVVLFFLIFLIIFNLVNQKNKKEIDNFNLVVKSEKFKNLGDYFISKINSPYKEVKYLIENNDSVEKILKKFEINADDIKIISNNLKQKKLTNIYAGKKLSLVLKRLEDGSNIVVSLVYPKSNTSSIEIRRS